MDRPGARATLGIDPDASLLTRASLEIANDYSPKTPGF
jgi:hypothetical protein